MTFRPILNADFVCVKPCLRPTLSTIQYVDWPFNQWSRSGKMSLSERFYALIPGEKITLPHASFKRSASRKSLELR